jgi:hypothetical protein
MIGSERITYCYHRRKVEMQFDVEEAVFAKREAVW